MWIPITLAAATFPTQDAVEYWGLAALVVEA